MRPMAGASGGPSMDTGSPAGARPGTAAGAEAPMQIPLGQLADVRIANGPPMLRDENGLLTGYVYVDIDTESRDIGGYVAEAKATVAKAQANGTLLLPEGYSLFWTGQYELLDLMMRRMRVVVPLTLFLVVLLLWLQFRDPVEVLIVLLSIPFALVGSVWLMWALDYRLSTAVWVGIIALVGLAAQTGIVMIVYMDHAYHARLARGAIESFDDILAATMEGTVQRVRPKLMTVSTMLIGLVPLLWATGSGADVMKRIAAPMVGGLLTSAFLTLEIIPVVYTYWRREQLVHRRLAEQGSPLERRLRLDLSILIGAASVAAGVLLAVELLGWGAGGAFLALEIAAAGLGAAACLDYGWNGRRARRTLSDAGVRW
jgi:Cu(I)/Ag(I) efflux system membrane protein CusA/SilA